MYDSFVCVKVNFHQVATEVFLVMTTIHKLLSIGIPIAMNLRARTVGNMTIH